MSDFERTFGAGANLDSIIAGYSYKPNHRDFDTDEIIFYDYSEALGFVKENPNLFLTSTSETYQEYCMFTDSLRSTVTQDLYKVSPLRKGDYIRVTEFIQQEYACKAIPQKFVLYVPYLPDKVEALSVNLDPRLMHIVDSKEITLSLICDYFGGDSMVTALARKPRELDEIAVMLSAQRMALVPVSDNASLIVSDGDSIDAALVTEGDCTYLVQYGFSYKIYNILV